MIAYSLIDISSFVVVVKTCSYVNYDSINQGRRVGWGIEAYAPPKKKVKCFSFDFDITLV